MDKELKGIVGEIVILITLMIIAIPICVKASSDYQAKKDKSYYNETISYSFYTKGLFE